MAKVRRLVANEAKSPTSAARGLLNNQAEVASQVSGEKLIEFYKRIVKHPRSMKQINIQQGIGLVPYRTIAFDPFRAIPKGSASSVRANSRLDRAQGSAPSSPQLSRAAARPRNASRTRCCLTHGSAIPRRQRMWPRRRTKLWT
jgi:hypothetical protein